MITLIVLYDDRSGEYYAGVTNKILTDDEKKRTAEQFNAYLDGEPGSHEEDQRTISFRECNEDTDLAVLKNVWKE